MSINSRVILIDYGSGNIHSISKALVRAGAEPHVTDSPREIEAAERVVLPGVGHFGDAMGQLEKRGLVAPIRRYAQSGRPFLGVCVGLQLLMESSEEAPGVEGLGLVKGKCVRFKEQPGLKIPHMGWNQVRVAHPAPILQSGSADEGGPWFYFVHSYYAEPTDKNAVAGYADYGIEKGSGEFCAAIWQNNIQATQFHPEKSQAAGLELLGNFVGIPASLSATQNG